MLKNIGWQIFSNMIGEAVMMPLQVLSEPELNRALLRNWWIGIMLLRLESGL